MRWSFSAWQTYKQCPLKYQLSYIERLDKGSSEALERGNKIHALAEDYLSDVAKVVAPELKKFEGHLKLLKQKKELFVEQAMAFTDSWVPCAYDDPNAWLRMKLDVLYPVGSNGVFVGDWKTGKVYPDHAEQLSIYALGCFMGLEADVVMAEDWYVDSGIKSKTENFNRNIDERPLLRIWNGRAERMASDKTFAPTPNKFCGWCPYSKGKGGQCKHGR